jgi:hypothetical protein
MIFGGKKKLFVINRLPDHDISPLIHNHHKPCAAFHLMRILEFLSVRVLSDSVLWSSRAMSILLMLAGFFVLPEEQAAAQFSPEISACAPSSGYRGQTIDLFIRGNNTRFDQNPQVSLGSGIRIDQITVQSSVSMVVKITLLEEAADGLFDLNVTAGGKLMVLENAFTVFTRGAEVAATLMVYPVGVVYASDLKPGNIKNAPLLFSIQVMNDALDRNLEARLAIKGQSKGLLANAVKQLGAVLGRQTVSFSNRDFSEISVSEAGQEISNYLQQTGMLPPDMYYYTLQIVDLSTGQVVAEAEGIQEIGNQAWEIQLLYPGSPFDQLPEPLLVSLPVFQWFSQAESFDFALYEVRENSASAEDITQSLPVFRQNGIKGNTFWWPNSAEPLREGATYAWQVKGNISSTSGPRVLPSPVWWFTMGKFGTMSPLIPQDFEMLVHPDTMKLATRQPGVPYKLVLMDNNKTEIPVRTGVVWKVVPSIAGRITPDGVFFPGDRPMKCAIVAQYGERTQFADAEIVWKPEDNFSGYMKYFIRELFGLP